MMRAQYPSLEHDAVILHRSPEPVEGRLTEKHPSTSSGLRSYKGHQTLIAVASLLCASCATAPTQPIANAVPAPALPSAFQAGWQGKQVCEPLYENESVRAARCTFPPGGGHDRHYHPAHWGYIVSGGTMRITTAKGTVDRVLKSGTNWWSDGIEWHDAVNIGEETAVYVIVEPKGAGKAKVGG